VLELIGLLNGGFLTRITDDSTRPVWQSAIPSEALQFEVGQSDVSPHTIFRMGDSVAVVAPLSPGSKQILITYLLPKSLDALTIPVDQPVRDMNIMLEDASATIGEGLFKLTGVEELAFAITELWWILVPLVALMLAGVLYWWLKRQPAPVAAAAPADTNAERLAHQIAQMDREFEANRASLSDPERDAYKRRRAELKGRLAEMLAACNKPS
jgi:hypothetical protein